MFQSAAIFGVSFVVALSGALSPGPLLTYTILEAGASRRRWWVGGAVIAGHAAVEAVILFALLAGLQAALVAPLARLAVGGLGSAALLWFGTLGVAEAVRELRAGGALPAAGGAGGAAPNAARAAGGRGLFAGRPALGGAMVSMSNPYWWIWWATFGSALIARFDLGFAAPVPTLAFFLGHEAGDLAWYLFVSIASSLGLSRLGGRARSGLFALLSAAIVGFGLSIGADTLGFALAGPR